MVKRSRKIAFGPSENGHSLKQLPRSSNSVVDSVLQNLLSNSSLPSTSSYRSLASSSQCALPSSSHSIGLNPACSQTSSSLSKALNQAKLETNKGLKGKGRVTSLGSQKLVRFTTHSPGYLFKFSPESTRPTKGYEI